MATQIKKNQIADDAVETAKIKNGNVTSPKLASGIIMSPIGTYAWNGSQSCSSTTVPVKLTNGYIDIVVPANKTLVFLIVGTAYVWMSSAVRGFLQLYRTVDSVDSNIGYIALTQDTDRSSVTCQASGTYDNSANGSSKTVRIGLQIQLVDAGTINAEGALTLYGIAQFY